MTFRRFFLVRLAWALFGLWFATLVVFLAFFVVPKRPEAHREGPWAPAGQLERNERYLAERYVAVDERYYRFLERLITGDTLRTYDVAPNRLALEAALPTLSIVIPGVFLALGVGIGVALLRPRGPPRLARLPMYLAVSLWSIWVGITLSYLVGHRLGWLPLGGYCDVFSPPGDARCGGAVDWAETLLLPWVTFAIPFSAVYGFTVSTIHRSDARPTALVMAQMIARDMGSWLGAALFVEVIFGIPGLGRLVIAGYEGFGAELMISALVLASVLAVAWHFLVNVAVAAVNPLLRREWPVASLRVPT